MRVTCHDHPFLTRCTYTTLASFMFWSMVTVVPPSAQAVELPLGLATGSKEAHLAFDGKQWVPLSSSSNPVYDGTMLRTGKGTASVLLKDGTQLELQSHTLIGVSGSRTAPVVKIAVGRVFFRVPVSSHTVLATPSVRYQTKVSNQQEGSAVVKVSTSVPSFPDLIGEIAVNPQGGSRIALKQGEMLASSVNDPGMHIVKANQSVYIPQLGNQDSPFGAMLAQVPQALSGGETAGLPVGAIPVYGEDGKSIGYITADGSFASSPGLTPNLSNPIPAGTIPPDANIPAGATPIFTATPEYAGYILDDKLFAYVPPAGGGVGGAGAGIGGGTGMSTAAALTVGGIVIAGGIGAGIAASGGGDGNGPASPSTP